MSVKVDNLSFQTGEPELRDLFGRYGACPRVRKRETERDIQALLRGLQREPSCILNNGAKVVFATGLASPQPKRFLFFLFSLSLSLSLVLLSFSLAVLLAGYYANLAPLLSLHRRNWRRLHSTVSWSLLPTAHCHR